MSFMDLLKQPLPSKKEKEVENNDRITTESVDPEAQMPLDAAPEDLSPDGSPMNVRGDVEESACDGGSGAGCDKPCGGSGCVKEEGPDDDDEDIDDVDISGLSDEELAELEADLEDSDLEDAAGDVEPVELSADEEREADDLMSLGATTELIRSELNVEERAAFYESTKDTQIAMFEGFLMESDVQAALKANKEDVVTEAKMYNKTRVQFSKEDRKAQLYSIAINVSARAHNDPDYVKYQKLCAMKRVQKKKLQKKYHNEAIKRMKVYIKRLQNSKSGVLSKIGQKIAPKR